MRYAFVVNPASGHGRTARKRARLEAAIGQAALDARIQYTTHRGHATQLSKALSAEADVVVAVGGDGTIQEVVAGLSTSKRPAILGVLPSGTGNDFAKMVGMPRTLEDAVAALAEAHPAPFDYGVVEWLEGTTWQKCAFANAVGIGFDAQTAVTADRYKRLPGVLGYLVAVIHTLTTWQSPAIDVHTTAPDQDERLLYSGPFFLTTAANGRSTGGGFYLTPDASITDGLLDLCAIKAAKKPRILRLLPQALRGIRLDEPEIVRAQITQLRLNTDAPLPIHADGEVLSEGTSQLAVHVVSNHLSVLLPHRRPVNGKPPSP